MLIIYIGTYLHIFQKHNNISKKSQLTFSYRFKLCLPFSVLYTIVLNFIYIGNYFIFTHLNID